MDVADASISVKKKAPKRTGHICFCYDRYMFIWGGYSDEDYYDYYLPAKELWIYDMQMMKKIAKPYPPPLSGCSCCVIDSTMYLFGGHGYAGNTNEMYKLNIKTLTWSKIDVEGPEPRFGIDLITFLYDNGKYVEDPNPGGAIPCPRAAHGAARIDSKVYVFGGRFLTERKNDLYSLDLLTLTWNREFTYEAAGEEMPCGRSWHTFSAISETMIFLYGGFSQDEIPLSDGWILDVSVMKWIKLDHIPNNCPRLWHTACVSPSSDVIIHGGCSNNILDNTLQTEHCRDVIVFNLQPYSLLRLCLEAVYQYRQSTESEWEYLPEMLSYWLKSKSKILETINHLNHRQNGVSVENMTNDDHPPSGPTCAVS
ncbi:hypothetical protein KUTeg_013047 [Tegillarca granosa]|uniref:Kelch domain-containing protein 10 n=1 Tax=Tegillarca granosa TaxID=220873 RepID=A0ABQ9EY19_TEGGR|nr:hypothetical protein KUTeg_013047 [Tegillarca granosa]